MEMTSEKRGPGRPKGPLSPEERESRRKGGLTGGRGRSASKPDRPGADDEKNNAIPWEPGNEDDDPEVIRRLSKYSYLPRPRDAAEAKTWETVRKEIYASVQAAIELRQVRKDLIKRADARAAMFAQRDQFARALETVHIQLSQSLTDLPPDQRAQIERQAQSLIRQALDRVKEAAGAD